MTTARTARRTAGLALAASAALLLVGCTADERSDETDPAPPRSVAPTVPDEPPTPTAAATRPPGKPGQPKGGIPTPGDVDQADATEVSRAALTAMWTYDTAIDNSRNDAGRRVAAAGWCTAAYADQLRDAAARSGPGSDWGQWAKHRAYTTVTLQRTEDAGRPRDTPTTAYRQWTLTLTPHGRDGWKGKPETSTAFVELTRSDGKAWRLAAVSVR
ncbi:hypothetical protein [Streptomyces chryseus]|uniref:hypothetical protein n=1 Tax=Streptomyces chryseus TaxID=68186 RepID=UPI00110FF64C|nr:hypothetical protein [Streptomyces chryseus]GGX36651.1 hypothetical protein GCM10010353_59730 [Streptomyces chryseus]